MALQQRLIQRRLAVWNGKISDYAAIKTLQMYEFILLGYLSVILCVAAACVCGTADANPASVVFFVLALVCGAVFLSLALWAGRAGATDIARQYGLPGGAWRKVRVKTPEQFERWLSRQPLAIRESNPAGPSPGRAERSEAGVIASGGCE